MEGHLESNRVSLLMVTVLRVQNNKLHHNVLALLQPAHLTVLFAKNT